MGWNGRVVESLRAAVCLIAVVSVFAAAARGAAAGLAMQAPEDGSAIRIVHGVANAGPLDIYVDGAIALIGIVSGEASGSLRLEAGDHAFAIVPSGAAQDAAIADGQISLQEGTQYYATLFGTAEGASVGLYAIDDRPVDAGRARFRIISGVADAGEVVPAFSGGDALSEPLEFGDASQYAAIDAGVYELEVLDTVTGGSLLSLPQTSFAEGTATDIVLYGQVSEGTLQSLVTPTAIETTPIVGRLAQIRTGSCAEPGTPTADLGLVQEGQGATVGASGTAQVAQGYGVAPIAFSALTASPHVVSVSDTAEANGAPIACGGIGGQLTDTGALVIALAPAVAGAPGGVAVLAPALENPEATGISVFLTDILTGDSPNSAETVSDEDAE